jgi:hypothetical protein
MRNPKPWNNSEAEVNFLSEIHQTNVEISTKADNYLQMLNGVLGVLIVLSIGGLMGVDYNQMNSEYRFGAGIIMFSLFTCLLITLLSLVLFSKKKRVKTNLFFFGNYLHDLGSWQDYSRGLKNTLDNRDNIINAYAYQIWNLAEGEIKPKFQRIKLVTRLLVAGLTIGTFFIILSFVHLS